MNFFEIVGSDMHIPKGRNETSEHYAQRVTLSAVSNWMLTAVFFDDGQTSVERVRETAQRKLRLYHTLGNGLEEEAIQESVNYIYDHLLKNGAFMHIQYYLKPARRRLIGRGNVAVVRGMMPEDDVCFSGLAPFVIHHDASMDDNIAEAFALPDYAGEAVIQMVWERATPVDNGYTQEEYLRTSRTSGYYYGSRREDSHLATLARSMNGSGGYDYYILNGDVTRRLPDDFIQARVHEYCALALVNRRKKQVVKATKENDLVHLEFGYRPPSPDLRFIRYISWPENTMNLDDAWHFSISSALWPMLKDRLSNLDFELEEST